MKGFERADSDGEGSNRFGRCGSDFIAQTRFRVLAVGWLA